MNSKILLILISIILAACGVKSAPIAPQNADVPSVLENYKDIESDKPLQDATSI